MLAYVFWHWMRPGVERAVYEASQARFHAALAQAPSAGFVGSWTASLRGATWVPQDREVYEDWYLVEGSTALDPLNDAAITASRKEAHDAAAALAEGGTAGLYRLRTGHLVSQPTIATWLAKPAGVPYPFFLAEMERALEGIDHGLWIRQMVLGPTPECCLHTKAPVTLPWAVACRVTLEPVWP